MSIGMMYRPIQRDDIMAISRVHRRACLIAYRFMNWSHSEDEVCAWYSDKFASWDWGLVAEESTKVTGFIATSGAFIDQLFVDPDHQRRGIGTSLLTTALQMLTPPVTLTVFKENAPARRLYERHGFRESGDFYNATERAVELVYRYCQLSG